MKTVERWGVFEWRGMGRSDGNPFTDHDIRGVFHTPCGDVTVDGFYDGDGEYAVRFMPETEGEYRYEIAGGFSGETFAGSFACTPASPDNHGPVRVRGMHFEYADGTPYHPFGTTCYVWELQDDALCEGTLAALDEGFFNKLRFCVFPKHYLYNLHEPVSYPYEGTPCRIEPDAPLTFGVMPGNDWDFTRFNPAHFRRVERSIAALGARGVEADLILMHPYDRWGFSEMPAAADDLYLRYALARFAAYRNVWWSLANEYDLLGKKTIADWERFAAILVDGDPYHHPRSIHNCFTLYDHTRPWITHCSIQRTDIYKTTELVDAYRTRYGKPVVMDEICYEGDIDQGWGNISGEELVRRFWEAAMRGGYASHGETFDSPDGRLWWSHGGALKGESPARIRFLRRIVDQAPAGLRLYAGHAWDETVAECEPPAQDALRIHYFGFNRPSSRAMETINGAPCRVEVIDTWNMTIEDAGVHAGAFRLKLPARPYMAVRLTAIQCE